MSRGIRISTIILSATLISSCAADRIQVAQKEDIACKTPKTRYDFGKNKPIQSIKSNNRKYTRYVFRMTRNNAHNSYSSKNNIRRDKQPEKLIYSLGETKNYPLLTQSGTNELMLLQQILKSTEIDLFQNELRKLPYPVRMINEPEDVIINPSQKDMLSPVNNVNNESGYLYAVLKKDDIIPNDSSDEVAVSIPDTVKSDQSQKTPFHKSETFILMMAILAGLIPFAMIKATPKLSTNISFWAAMNPWKTRFMIAVTQIALGTMGFLLGEKLADNGVHFSDLSKDLLVGAFLTSSLLYPVKHTSIKLLKHSYLKQKAFDMALVMSGFMLMVNAGNNPELRASFTSMVNFKGHEQQNVNILNDHSQTSTRLLYFHNDNQSQDEQTAPQKKEPSRGLKILYTVLAVLAALVLGCFVAAAVCGLWCNELYLLSVLAGVGGGGLIIWIAISAIKSIWHPKAKKRKKPSEGTNFIPQESTLQT